MLRGESGSGKTTCARLYARALNCEAVTPEGSPCNRCEPCVGFLGEVFPDYLEFDGGSLGQKDRVVQLADIARRPPLIGKRRVVLVDEGQGALQRGVGLACQAFRRHLPPVGVLYRASSEEGLSITRGWV